MNCIWITTDSFRQDHVRCYRPEGTMDDTGRGLQVRTPSMDRLASEGVMFTRMRAEALPTIPCRRGIFTGRRVFPWREEPKRKGVHPDFPAWRPLPEEDVTVAEHLSAQGYVTSIVADAYHLWKPAMNMHRGFDGFHWVRGQGPDRWRTQPLPDGYVDRFVKPGVQESAYRNRVLTQFLRNHADIRREDDMPVAQTFRHAIDWIEQNAAHDRFFLYIDTFSPHEPWLPPQEYLDLYADPEYDGPELIYANMYRRCDLSDAEHRHVRARYAAMCTMVDRWIGRLLDAVDRAGLRESTLIILMSDHGKIIGEFGHYGMPAQDTGLALNPVPCVVRHPAGEHAGRRFDGWLYNIDLTATVLDLLDVEPKPDVEGASVWPAAADSAGSFRDGLVTAYGPMLSAWQDDRLYLRDANAGTAALYNLAEDPYRKRDLADRYPAIRDDLARKVDRVAQR